MVLRILGRKTSSNVQKVLWCLAELEIPFERIDVGGEFGGNDQPDYLALNPNGVVPTLDDNGFILWESNACVRYLCAKHSYGALYPSELTHRADADRWMDWQQTTLGPPMGMLFRKFLRRPSEDIAAAEVEAAKTRAARAWAMLDARLSKQAFVTGLALSMADFAFGNAVHRWFSLPIERRELKGLRAYYDRLCARQAYQRAVLGV